MGCKACAAHQSHIESLEKQLDFFRSQLQPAAVRFPLPTGESPAQGAPYLETLPWVSEEEEELMAMKQAGLIDNVKDALEQVGAMTNEIEFS